jgi:hypothetical protein
MPAQGWRLEGEVGLDYPEIALRLILFADADGPDDAGHLRKRPAAQHALNGAPDTDTAFAQMHDPDDRAIRFAA